MEHLLLLIIGILFLIIFALLAKIYFLRRSAHEIAEAFRDRLAENTNTLIDISSRDRYMRSLANSVNTELRTLRDKRRRYEQGDMELKEAVTNISHDLRTPLTAICAYLDLLDREEKSEKVRLYLAQIQNRAEVLKNLTEELFHYSVVTTSQELKPDRVNVVHILQESLLSFYGVMREKEIRPQIDLPEVPVYRDLDINALNRIFSNIISNALKYTDGDFSVCMKEDGSIVFSNRAESLNTVSVGRLFDRFYTVEAHRNSTGLGLSIAKNLTERMGGLIDADYTDGKLFVTVQF